MKQSGTVTMGESLFCKRKCDLLRCHRVPAGGYVTSTDNWINKVEKICVQILYYLKRHKGKYQHVHLSNWT